MSKMKACVDDKISVTQNVQFIFHRVENIVRIGDFLLSQKSFPQGCQKLSLYGKK